MERSIPNHDDPERLAGVCPGGDSAFGNVAFDMQGRPIQSKPVDEDPLWHNTLWIYGAASFVLVRCDDRARGQEWRHNSPLLVATTHQTRRPSGSRSEGGLAGHPGIYQCLEPVDVCSDEFEARAPERGLAKVDAEAGRQRGGVGPAGVGEQVVVARP